MKIILLLPLIFIPISAFLFYWYEWRPSVILKECHKFSVEKAIKDLGSKRAEFLDEDYEFRYKYCLHEKGLK